MKSASEYRAQALETLKGNWKPAVLACLVFFALYLVFYTPLFVATITAGQTAGVTFAFLGVFMLFVLFFFMPLSFCMMAAFLRRVRGSERTILGDTFNIFRHRYGRILGIGLLLILIVYALCIPMCALVAISAIVESEMVSSILTAVAVALMIPIFIYVLAVEPIMYAHEDYSAGVNLFRLSRHMMRGHKWQLFCLYLSFIGWGILSVFTLGIGLLWLSPYMYTAVAHFYEDVRAEYEAKLAAPEQ